MPSTYCVLYEEQAEKVLIAKKREEARWAKNDTKQSFNIVNNPGEYVFPGGQCEDSSPSKMKKQAILEFLQETGLCINKDNTIYSGAFSPPKQIATISHMEYKKLSEGKGGFGVLYIAVHRDLLESVERMIKVHIAADSIHFAYNMGNFKRYDDEIEDVEIQGFEEAKAIFKAQGDKSPWFLKALENVPNKKDVMVAEEHK